MTIDESRHGMLDIPIIFGPTASGKTSLSERLSALDSRIEIISADSCQVYRGLDIGTAKADRTFRDRVPHHLIDILAPTETYSAGRFALDARKAIMSIRARKNHPLIVGGTGFYLRALFEGLAAPPLDREIAAHLNDRLRSEGIDSLRRELIASDPNIMDQFDLMNPEKVIRALGCFIQNGEPYSAYVGMEKKSMNLNPAFLLLDPERKNLYDEIDRRVVEMIDNGLIDEVEMLRSQGIADDAKGFRSVGYPDVIRLLNGEISKSEMIASIQQSTRRFAKRQSTWMRTQIIPRHDHFVVDDFEEGEKWYRQFVDQ